MTDVATVDAAADRAAVVQRVGQSGTSFYTAMRLLPPDRRDAMFAIYAFCREVDDIADEPAPQAAKHRGLETWRREIALLYAGGTPANPLARALAQPIALFDLQQADFLAVVDGMQMDADREIKAPSLAELDLYCARVAGAVGRLSVRAFGPWQKDADEVADQLGRALQLTNILRDLDEDAERGRLYLPREVLVQHGIASEEPSTVLGHPALPGVCTELAQMARTRFAAAESAMARCDRRTMRPARMMGGIYSATLERLVHRGWAAPRQAVKVAKPAKLWIALRSWYF